MPARVLATPLGGTKPNLADVTLIAATSVAATATLRALERCIAQADFGAVRLLTDQPPPGLEETIIEMHRIAPIRSRSDYSRFILERLVDFVDTRFALIVQWDGYVTNGACWRQQFLDYDYIGAPWPHFHDGSAVGNGGFSLRSRRLLAACGSLGQFDDCEEDVLICRVHRERLESEFGLRFAPVSIARHFAYERSPRNGNEFGFHGVFNMMHDMPTKEFVEVLSTLEPRLLGRRESGEIIRHAARTVNLPTLRQGLRQRFRVPFDGNSYRAN